MKNSVYILTLALVCAFSMPSAAATLDEQRAGVQRMENNVLNQLYRLQPRSEGQISRAAGYAVFSDKDVAALFVSGTIGHGIAHNNQSGDDIYMKMASAGVGLGLGLKDFRTVFVFDTPKGFQDFTTTGLDLSGNADIAAKEGAKGGATSGERDVLPGVKVYQLTKTGLLAQVMLSGTKYWRDGELNQDDIKVRPETIRYHYNNQE